MLTPPRWRRAWKSLRRFGRLLDRHSGTMSAFATVAIAALTAFYVHYSKAQWGVMRSQLRMSAARLAIGEISGDIGSGGVLAAIDNYGHIPSAKTHITVRWQVQNGPIIALKPLMFGGDYAEAPPGKKHQWLRLPLNLDNPSDLPHLVEAVRAGRALLHLSGVIQYDNGFGEPASSAFCFTHVPATAGESSAPLGTRTLCPDAITPLLHALDPSSP